MTTAIESVLQENRVFPPAAETVRAAAISGRAAYDALCAEAERDNAGYWARLAYEHLSWKQPFTQALDESNAPFYKWFADGKLNVSYNCLDRNIEAGLGNKVAIIFEADDGKISRITYKELLARVGRFANALKARGIKKGDRVIIYLPMSVEGVVAMQACARIGAIHSVVFGGFSAKSLEERILDAGAVAVITADEQCRGGKSIPLKPAVDEGIALTGGTSALKTVIVYKRTGGACAMEPGRDIWWHDAEAGQSEVCEPEWVDAEHPLFLLYTSGSTGKPKGVQHSSGGYLLHAKLTCLWTFDLKPSDVFWCTADIGWVTGHTYIAYGPLACGATEIVFEGVPTYPDAGRFWKMIQDHKVSVFYTAPTAIRSLIKAGEANPATHPRNYDLKSLRLLGSVGEPINPEAWMWYYDNVGGGRCPILDTFWQTETGSIMITPLPAAIPTKPGSATLPFFGVEPVVLDEKGVELHGNGVSGVLCFKRAWPSMARTIQNDHGRFVDTYLKPFPGYYFTGDGCRRDEDGYWWITGRVDDVINVSGHRMGTAEVESALVSHPGCAEAAVCGYPHEIKGQGIFAYVLLKEGYKETPELIGELRNEVRHHIGPIATPDVILIAPGLPKTRSGKIMRRILRKIAADETDNLGDTSTLADPGVVQLLIEKRRALVK